MKMNTVLETLHRAKRVTQGGKSLVHKGIGIAKKVDSTLTAPDRITVDPIMRFLFDGKK